MKITPEQLQKIEQISESLSHKFAFGYYSQEDIKQEAIIIGMEGMKDYDPARPLENFLWTHISNRLINLKRDKFMRPQKPCNSCPLYNRATSSCTKYTDQMDCDLYSNWQKRNDAKSSLTTSFGFGDDEPDVAEKLETNIEAAEIYQKIDRLIPIEKREDWIRFVNGLKLAKQKREEMVGLIKSLIQEE